MIDNQMPNVSGNTGGAWGTDFSGQLNTMLAPYQQVAGPYQQIAKQFQNPYMTMSQNSWLARNHPQVAGALDNAFLTMGMTPQAQGPEGAGGGISRMMQGLMGGVQARRQQAVQNAMLPYQMMMPQLQAQDIASQIGERQAMVPFRMAQERRYDAQSQMYYDRMAQGDRSKALAGPDLTDDKGGSWSRIFDPISGSTRLYNPVLQKHADELPADQQPAFTKEQRNQRMSQPGGLMGEIIDMRMSSDPAVRARGEQMSSMYTGMEGTIAGKRAGATQGVTEPPKDTKTFIGQERQAAYNTLPKLQSANDYQSAHITDADYWKNPQKAYEGYVKNTQTTRQQMDVDLAKYEKSSAPRTGISFQEYLQNRSMYDGSAPSPAPQAATSTTGSSWVPK